MVPDLKLQLGELYRVRGQYEDARVQFEEVKDMEEMEEQGLYHLARLFFSTKDYQDSLKAYRDLLVKYPEKKYRVEALRSIAVVATVSRLQSKETTLP